MRSHPRSAPEIEAAYCYLALPEDERKAISQEDFAKEVEEFLVETGDLDADSKLATSKGESHGFHNAIALDWDDGVKNVTYTSTVVRANKEAQEYIKCVVVAHYPSFDEEKYAQIKRGKGDRITHGSLFGDACSLPRKAYELLDDLIEGRLREWINDIVYISLDEEEIGAFLSIYKHKTYDHDKGVDEDDWGAETDATNKKRRESPQVLSGNQVNLIIKEEKYYKSGFGNRLRIPYNQDTVIFHFEDISDPDVQKALADTLWSTRHSDLDIWSTINSARLIMISTLMPYEYHIGNEKLRKLVLSAPAFDLRASKPARRLTDSVTLRGIISNIHYRYSPTNTALVDFDLTVFSSFQTFKCVAYYNLADFVFCNFLEGEEVVVLGKLHNYHWTNEEYETASRVEIICDNVYALPEGEPSKEEDWLDKILKNKNGD